MKARVISTNEIIDVEKREDRVGNIVYVYYCTQSGESFQDYELEFLSDTPEKVTLEGWVARDEEFDEDFFPTDIFLYKKKPIRNKNLGTWESGLYDFAIPHDSFPSVTWETEPKRVKLTITLIEE